MQEGKKIKWDGDGLPPEGCECYAICRSANKPKWFRIRFFGVFDDRPAFLKIHENEVVHADVSVDKFDFCQAKEGEQISNDWLIDKMVTDAGNDGWHLTRREAEYLVNKGWHDGPKVKPISLTDFLKEVHSDRSWSDFYHGLVDGGFIVGNL